LPESASDIAAAVRFARAHGLEIAVKGGGHSAAGSGVCDDGMMINLRHLNQVTVDATARTARAGGGALWGEFDPVTVEHGLATTGGAVATTGIGGLTVGGGLGWLMRSHGLTCDNLLSADIVTADGELVRASAGENADLFWGIRGGGGNFGIAATFEYQLHPIGQVLAGLIAYPVGRCAEVLRLYREVTQSAPEALTVYYVSYGIEGEGLAAAVALCYNGAPSDGERLVAPFRALGTPVVDTVEPRSYASAQVMLTEGYPYGRSYYRRSNWITGIDEGVVQAIVESSEDLPTYPTNLAIEHGAGAVRRTRHEETAFGHRAFDYDLLTMAAWDEPGVRERCIDWTKEFWDKPAISEVSRGVYVNYIGFGEGQDRVRAAYGAETYDRLVALKRKYDPQNALHLNPNIDPAGVAGRQPATP
jgi:FAD/FMN-containing dehydrogenase